MIYLLKCWDSQKDIWKVWLSWENRCTECIGCFDWFWHCKLELLWGKLGPNSTTVENFGEGSRKRVCLRLCVCGGSVPLPFWLEFFQCSWMILRHANNLLSETSYGFGVSVTPGSHHYSWLHYWAWEMGWNTGWENPQPESLAVHLWWRGCRGGYVDRSLSKLYSHEDKGYSGL